MSRCSNTAASFACFMMLSAATAGLPAAEQGNGQDPPVAPPQEGPQAGASAGMGSVLSAPWAIRIDEVSVAGLPQGSRAYLLTLERAYSLALIRARARPPTQGGDRVLILDPTRMTE